MTVNLFPLPVFELAKGQHKAIIANQSSNPPSLKKTAVPLAVVSPAVTNVTQQKQQDNASTIGNIQNNKYRESFEINVDTNNNYNQLNVDFAENKLHATQHMQQMQQIQQIKNK